MNSGHISPVKFTMFHLVSLALGLLFFDIAVAGGQAPPSIKTGCNGALNAPMVQTAAPYQRALAALNGSEVGWCAIASEFNLKTSQNLVLWELSSAAYVFHAMRGRKELTLAQQTAMRELLTGIKGIGTPPSRLKQIDKVLYVHMRTLAAEDSTESMVQLDAIKQYAPAVYQTLIRRSNRWGDSDDN